MASISKRVRSALFARLSRVFNDRLQALSADYGVQPFTIDFNAVPKSSSFFFGRLDPVDIEESSVFRYPFMCVYTRQSANQTRQKPATFSGVVNAGVDIHLTWLQSAANQDFETLADCVEETVIGIMNDLTTQNWGQGIIYSGQIGCDRGMVTTGAKNWRQKLTFTMVFEVVC